MALRGLSTLPLIDRYLWKRARHLIESSGLLSFLIPRGALLDVGTGLGHLAVALALSLPIDVLAIDPYWSPSRRVLKAARSLQAGKVVFQAGRIQDVPLEENSIQAALLAFVLHHVAEEDQPAVIGGSLWPLTPKGRLIVLEDTPTSPDQVRRVASYDRRLNCEVFPHQGVYHGPQEWRDLFLAQGLKFLHQKSFHTWDAWQRASIPHTCFIFEKADV